MDFLLQTNVGSYYTSLIFFAIMFIACVALVFLIGKEDFATNFYDKNFFSWTIPSRNDLFWILVL